MTKICWAALDMDPPVDITPLSHFYPQIAPKKAPYYGLGWDIRYFQLITSPFQTHSHPAIRFAASLSLPTFFTPTFCCFEESFFNPHIGPAGSWHLVGSFPRLFPQRCFLSQKRNGGGNWRWRCGWKDGICSTYKKSTQAAMESKHNIHIYYIRIIYILSLKQEDSVRDTC